MEKIKAICIKTGIVTAIIALLLYVLFLTVVPKVLSSHLFLDTIDEVLANKTGIVLNCEKLRIRTFPSLNISIAADEIIVKSNDKELLKVKNADLTFDIKRFKPKKAEIEYIYLDQSHVKNAIIANKNKSSSDFHLKSMPEIHIKKGEIWAQNDNNKTIFIDIENINVRKQNNKTICTFEAKIISNLLRNVIQVGKQGYLYIEGNKLYSEKLGLLVGTSQLTVEGKILDNKHQTDFTLKGQNLPISDIAASLLYFQKLNDNSKKFMENFYDYGGKLNIDLNITNNGIFGTCNAIKLSGKTVLFDVPILFEKVPFKFLGDKLSGGGFGLLGGEKVYSDFTVTNLAKNNQEAKGSVQAVLTNKSIGKYVEQAELVGNADVSVNWNIKDKKIKVDYKLYIPKNSDIYYQDANLGLTEQNRKLLVDTFKFNDKLEITNYEYSVEENEEKTKIIMGNGLFTKKNGHLKPDFITCKTENNAPVSVAGSFYKFLQGGIFNGDLKYDFNLNKITGNFNIKNSVFKNYKLDTASVTATPEQIIIEAEGEYKKSPFNAKIVGINNFNDKIKVNSIDLFLNELNVTNNNNQSDNIKIKEKTIKETTENFDVDLYTVKLDKLIYKRIILANIFVTGSIKNNIFSFEMPHINFAKGFLSAKGRYNFDKRTSDVVFTAKNIDSNIAADLIFNLPNQVQGIANATLAAKTKNGIEDKDCDINFSIKDGYLEKLGSTEFIIKQSRKENKPLAFKLKDIINIDIKNMKALSSNIKGSFNVHNGQINNAHITSSQKYLSMLITGNYNIDSQQSDIKILGKYNNTEISRIKIFFVPLSLVVKLLFRPEKTKGHYQNQLKQVPDITAKKDEDISAFHVKLTGNPNKKDIKVELKSLL